MLIVTILGVLLGFGYWLMTFLLQRIWQHIPSRMTPHDFLPKTPISVIVAAKNESSQISSLVSHLLAQNYPGELVEFIIIDDHSDDDMVERLYEMDLPRNFHVLKANEESGKKAAITQGVEFASGELMVTTDADCIMDPAWLLSIAWLYETRQPKFIAGPVLFYAESNLFERFQSLDFLGMMLITGAGIKSHRFYMANGANMAFEKSTFLAVEGYKGNRHIASGDDMFLISKVARQFPKGSIYFNKNLDGVVRTVAAPTLSGFFRQRIRWGSKNTASKDVTLKWILAWVLLTSLWLVFFWWTKFGLVVLFLKMMGDFLLLRAASRYFGRRDLMKVFLPAFLMHTFYIALIGALSLFWKRVKWR
ncbi:MAG TPA: glycosyltransferase [Saprospiraceae bacterium]|nr:glycosyltransferase [Saprospiraceae bacterium]